MEFPPCLPTTSIYYCLSNTFNLMSEMVSISDTLREMLFPVKNFTKILYSANSLILNKQPQIKDKKNLRQRNKDKNFKEFKYHEVLKFRMEVDLASSSKKTSARS